MSHALLLIKQHYNNICSFGLGGDNNYMLEYQTCIRYVIVASWLKGTDKEKFFFHCLHISVVLGSYVCVANY